MPSNTTKIKDKGNTKFIAHRGLSGIEMENTAAAFIAAANRTYYGIETDIWRTSDGNFVLNHDGRTGRICEVNFEVEKTTFDKLRALNLKDKDGATDRKELIIPTPYEYRKICAGYEKICVPELKSAFTEEEIAQILEIFSPHLDRTCFISFGIENLDKIKAIKPNQTCQFLTGVWDDGLPEMLEKRGMGLDIAYKQLTEERIRMCHEHGVEVNCWTVDSPEDAESLISWGIDYITTNILE